MAARGLTVEIDRLGTMMPGRGVVRESELNRESGRFAQTRQPKNNRRQFKARIHAANRVCGLSKRMARARKHLRRFSARLETWKLSSCCAAARSFSIQLALIPSN